MVDVEELFFDFSDSVVVVLGVFEEEKVDFLQFDEDLKPEFFEEHFFFFGREFAGGHFDKGDEGGVFFDGFLKRPIQSLLP